MVDILLKLRKMDLHFDEVPLVLRYDLKAGKSRMRVARTTFKTLCGQPSMVYDRAYYESQYRDYSRQNPARKLTFYRSIVEAAVGGIMRPRILDVGCAFGHFLSSLPSHWERCGIDASEYAINLAARRVPDVQFAISGPDRHPFDGSFDVITAFDVLEHVESLEDMYDWIVGSLRPGGAFVFVVPVYDGLTGPLIRLLDRDPTHVHKVSRGFWLHRVEPRLELIDWWGIFRYLLPGGLYVHLVTHALRACSPAIAGVMRRR